MIMTRISLATVFTALLLIAPNARTSAAEPREAIRRGEAFLVGLLDPELGLLPEYRGADVYWLYHDNYLAAKVLAKGRPEFARGLTAAIHREGVRKSGKIEMLFGEAEKPLPFRQYQLRDVRRAGGKVIRTEVATDKILEGWQEYADLLLMASVAERGKPAAREHWDAAIRMWDGKGFLDAAAKHQHQYATYKLGLALIAAGRLSPPAEPPKSLLDRLLGLQADSGGWITDYNSAGRRIGLANVETTCISMIGIGASGSLKQAPTDKEDRTR